MLTGKVSYLWYLANRHAIKVAPSFPESYDIGETSDVTTPLNKY
jgi:hypothetical protein